MIADNDEIPVMKLSWRQRLLLAWEMTWPLSLMDLAVVVFLHGMLEVQGEAADSIWAVIEFFVISPWVIRRAIAHSYGLQRVSVLRGSEERPRLTYQESLKVMWLLAWRSTVLSLIALLVISLILRLVAPGAGHSFDASDPYKNAIGLSAIDTIASLAFTPLLIPGMLRKRFRGFHLEVREATPKSPIKARS